MKIINLEGRTFGRLTVLCRAPDKILPSGRKIVMWTCQCGCKNKTIKDIYASSLLSNETMSCGCLASLQRYYLKEIGIIENIKI